MRRFTIRRFKVRHFVVHYLTFQNWSFENLSYPVGDASLSGSLDALLEAEPLLALRPIADHLPGHRREGFRLFQILKKKKISVLVLFPIIENRFQFRFQ